MKTNNPSFFLYVFSSIFAVIGIAIENEFLTLLMKPMIIPAILYYYLFTKKEKINWLFLIALFSNLIFIYLAVKDISLINLSNIKFFYFVLIVIGSITIFYVVLNLMSGLHDFSNNLYVIYGIVLCTLASIIGFNHLNQQNDKTFYALIMCIYFIKSNVFFAVYNFYLNLQIFIILNVTVQFAGYYYMVRYITCNSYIRHEVL